MLRVGELASLRSALVSAFPDTCDILGNVGAVNGLGNAVESWQPVNVRNGVVVAVACRVVVQNGSSEVDVAARSTSAAEAFVFLPVGTVVNAANRIRIYGGVTYEVKFRQPAQSEDLSLQCDCMLIE